MNTLIVDFETSGLPNYKDPSDHPDQPHIIEAAWTLYGPDGEPIGHYDAIVDPGVPFVMNAEAAATHGITIEMIEADGVPASEMHEQFMAAIEQADQVSAFNATFDLRMMRILSARLTQDKWECPIPKVCSMSGTNAYIKTMRSKPDGYKWPPTLAQAIQIVFNEEMAEAHRARPDCDNAARLFHELKRLAA
jgi:DNA polymerase-3 subunit epsilon